MTTPADTPVQAVVAAETSVRGRRGLPRPSRWLGRSPERPWCRGCRPPAGSSPSAASTSIPARRLDRVEKAPLTHEVDATRPSVAAMAARCCHHLRRACKHTPEGAAAVSQWVCGRAAAAQSRQPARSSAQERSETRCGARAARAYGWGPGAARTGSRPCAPGTRTTRRPAGRRPRTHRARCSNRTGDFSPLSSTRRDDSRATGE